MYKSTRTAYVFDLDETAIDSGHRVKPCYLPNGDLDLQKYIAEACTEEKIMSDTLLPLASYMQKLIQAGELVIVCTARYCNATDYYFLRTNKLRPAIMCSRDRLASVFGEGEGARISALGDAAYKKVWFDHLMQTLPDTDFVFFDDHDGVLEMAKGLDRVSAMDAKVINQLLELHLVDMYEQGEADTVSLFESLIRDASESDLIIEPEAYVL